MKTHRLEFSRKTQEQRWIHANGRCEYCGQEFGNRRPEYHHERPSALGGDNSFCNCRCICSRCHGIVTKNEDMPRITRAKRTERNRAGLKKSRNPMLGSKASGLRKRMNGKVERRS